jgi:tRNA pseudouridine38-40 synthase
MRQFKLTVAYDGTGLVGWQRQARGVSVQGLLEEALLALEGRAVVVTGAGRTDAGVHALGQVACATLARTLAPPALVRAINASLPPSVRVLEAEEVPDAFHARFSARAKTYRYRIWNSEIVSPFEQGRVWHVPAPWLDVAEMASAARRFVGRHDFAAFQATGTEIRDTVREIRETAVVAETIAGGALVTFTVTGEGFLRHMVRIMAGTIAEVGRGRRPSAWVADLMDAGRRADAGPTAPAEGLFLVRVHYD